jgi:hypothetical protein
MKTKIFTVVILLLSNMITFAQAPNWDWAREGQVAAASQAGCRAYSNVSDASGNVYVTGSFRITALTMEGSSLTNSGGYDFFIAKFNRNGILQWMRKAGGTGDEEGFGIAIDNLSNVIVTGYFTSGTITFGTAPFLTNNTSGTADIFVVKI